MKENYQIITFFIIFLLIIIVYYHFYLYPQKQIQQDLQKKKQHLQSFMHSEKENQEDIAIKSSQMIHNPRIDYDHHLVSENEIKIEDSFSDSFPPHIPQSETINLIESSVPTLNTQQCWYSKEFECPSKNGSLLQCTNNYIPKPNQKNCDCSNRTFEMCPFPYKISENEYYKKIGFNREKEFAFVPYSSEYFQKH